MSYQSIHDRAVRHKGSVEAVDALLPAAPALSGLAALGDDRLLAEMTKCVFQAGFSWTVIEKKWPGFEAAFDGFQPRRWQMMSDDDLDRLVSDTRVVRNGQKILSVRDNARLLCELADANGSAAKFLAEWPSDNQVGLMALLKKRGSRLGGTTGQIFLRRIGWDAFILTGDVVRALIAQGIVDKAPTSQKALAATQTAFNDWHKQSGRSYAQISRLLALSMG